MKFIYLFTTTLALMIVFSHLNRVNAQTFTIANGVSDTTCTGTFLDSGGDAAPYSSNEMITYTLVPGTPGDAMEVIFTSFNVENNIDYLKVYNGPMVPGVSLIGSYTGTTLPGTITSTHPTGALSFVFVSNGSIEQDGWSAIINCSTLCVPADIPVLTATPATACNGSSSTITIDGNLNDALKWAIYTDSCEGTIIGVTSASTYAVLPSTTTTYYVHGIGGCATPTDCASITVNVGSTTYGVDVVTACDSITWIDGNTYTSSGYATHVLTNAAGCDSIVTLDLTINNIETVDEVIACYSYTWIDGITYYASNCTASYTYASATGCDSTVYLDLVISNPTSSVDTVVTCGPYTWIDGVTYTSSNYTAAQVSIDAYGCEHTTYLHLTVLSIGVIELLADIDTICPLDNQFATLQWVNWGGVSYSSVDIYDDATGSIVGDIVGPGHYYAVGTTTEGCSMTSDTKVITSDCSYLGLEESTTNFEIYPNPARGSCTIELEGLPTNAHYSVTDINGKQLLSGDLPQAKNNIDLQLAKGCYFVHVSYNAGRYTRKLIVE